MMTAHLIDGKAISAQLRAQLTGRIQILRAQYNVTPGLAAVLVGDDPAAHAYWRNNRKACAEAGIVPFDYTLPATTTQAELDSVIAELNARPDVHGLLVHAPLPPPLDEAHTLALIALHKDVDGANPATFGRLAVKAQPALFAPATPAGVIRLLKIENVSLHGARTVVIGRSRVVGLPLALLLLREDATVTVCHSRTPDLPSIAREADVLIAAVGRAGLVTAEWVKPGAVVIDIGINRVDDPATGKARTVGDVDFETVKEVASALTPVPGGVGPMTIATLLEHVVRAAERTIQ
ncbi:MAG: bifunctional 5,10-methylenetetrahydrofolate dehydrogenase/5,10-methenyltetrahydrofolate cyclohydrolase [Aggregatilineales bacterium]